MFVEACLGVVSRVRTELELPVAHVGGGEVGRGGDGGPGEVFGDDEAEAVGATELVGARGWYAVGVTADSAFAPIARPLRRKAATVQAIIIIVGRCGKPKSPR